MVLTTSNWLTRVKNHPLFHSFLLYSAFRAVYGIGILVVAYIFIGQKYCGFPKTYERRAPRWPISISKRLLKCFSSAANNFKIDYALHSGALLGEVRDGDLRNMWWDYDLDITVDKKAFKKNEKSFKKYVLQVCELDWNSNMFDPDTGLGIDLYMDTYHHDHTLEESAMSLFGKWESEPCVIMKNLNFRCLKRAEKYLAYEYGENFRSQYPKKIYYHAILLVVSAFILASLEIKERIYVLIAAFMAYVMLSGTLCYFVDDCWCLVS